MGKSSKTPAIQPVGYGGDVERYRPRTPAEVVDTSYSAIVQAASLNTVTHMALESAATVANHRAALIAAFPGIEPELNAISFNHIQSLLQIQRTVAESMHREK